MTEEDEFNLSLAKMEEEIKPKILKLLESLNKNYFKLQKYQKENLECILSGKELSVSKSTLFMIALITTYFLLKNSFPPYSIHLILRYQEILFSVL